MTDKMHKLLILGCGYVGERLARPCLERGIRVLGTTRDADRAMRLKAVGIQPLQITAPGDITGDILGGIDAILDSIPLEHTPDGLTAGQPHWTPVIAWKLKRCRWAGYLSTTGVYGDAEGTWVDEGWPCNPTSQRGRERLKAEQAWLESGLSAEVFRLAGIYGPGRNILPRLKAGGYKAVCWTPPHYSGRIHVDDIVAAILAAMDRPRPGRIVNLTDDEPLPHADYVCELAAMIGAPAPILLPPDKAERALSAAAMDFFRDSKCVRNRLMHRELLAKLKYPNFRTAVADLV